MNDIKEVQNAILKVAKEIHHICDEHNIKYFMLGGTFLGAIRHKGFIPWDDDIDLGMTYDQYQKFINVIKNLNHPWLVFDIPEYRNKDYNNLFIKAYDKNTTFIEHDKPQDIKGVFVDIIPIINAYNNKNKCKFEIQKAFIIRRLLLSKRYNIYTHKPFLNLIARCVSSVIPRKLLFLINEKQYKKLHKLTHGKFYVALDGDVKNIYKSSFFEEDFILYPFENTAFYGIKNYDAFLTDVFANYMKLPPLEKRISHHLKYFSATIPFKEYKRDQNSHK